MHDPFINTERETLSRREPSFKMSTGQLGMLFFLASLTMLFGATLIGYLITRANNNTWRTVDMPGLPVGLVATTLVMFAQAGTMHWALRSIRRNNYRALMRALYWSLGLAVAFMLCQTLNWHEVYSAELGVYSKSLYIFTFYMLTGVHALHIIGGLVPLGVVIYRARQKEYSSSRYEGLKFCVQYWHFLGVVWLILLATLILAT